MRTKRGLRVTVDISAKSRKLDSYAVRRIDDHEVLLDQELLKLPIGLTITTGGVPLFYKAGRAVGAWFVLYNGDVAGDVNNNVSSGEDVDTYLATSTDLGEHRVRDDTKKGLQRRHRSGSKAKSNSRMPVLPV